MLASGELEYRVHRLQLWAPVRAVYEFAGQLKQFCKFFCGVYVPGRQRAHGPLSGPYAPALHVQYGLDAGEFDRGGQDAQVVAPEPAAYVPAVHSEQSAEFAAAVYFPGVQRAHGPPLGPRAPALHVHVVLPTGELESDGQDAQAGAAVAEENVLARHEMQPVALTTTAYVPAPHALHVAVPATIL